MIERKKRNNIAEYNEEFKFNKMAFDDVIGDPFAIDREGNIEPRMGNYLKLQRRSSIQVSKNEFDMGKATGNSAQPNVNDFLCDVDHIIMIAFAGDSEILVKFQETYILESTDTAFTPKERSELEQKLGKLFRRHKLSPVSKYFTTIRGKLGVTERKQNGNTGTSNKR